MALTDNLEAYWPLDGNSTEATGAGPNGTDTSVTYSAAQIGLGAETLVLTGQISLGAGVALSSTFTINLWMRPNASPFNQGARTTYGALISEDNNNGLFLQQVGSGPMTFELWVGNSLRITTSLTPGDPYVVTLTCDGTTTRLYLNNVQVGTWVGTVPWTVKQFLLGSSGNSCAALLDEVGIWSRVLSPSEVSDLYNGGAGLAYPLTTAAPPTITDVNPGFGPAAGGTEVTITGSDFVDGATVEIGGVSATSVEFVSDTELTAIVPVLAAGLHDVVVTNPDDQSDTALDAWEAIAAPAVTSVSPATGPDEGGTAITITGTDFDVGATVTIGGSPASSVVRVNSTTVTAVTPAHAVGSVDVVVTNPDEQSDSASFVYIYAPLEPEASALIKLLPPGVLWFLELGSQLRNLLRGIADEFKRIRLRGVDLINESDPRTASETLEDWERVLSLPDDLVTSIPGTTAGRRVAITQKYIGRGGSNDEFYEQLCAACGYPLLSITRHAEDVLRSGTAQSGDVVVGIDDAYTITLELDTPTAGALTEAQFEAVVRARTHSHIQVVFTY